MFKKEARGGKRELVLRKDVVSEAVAGAVEDGDDLYAVTSLNYLELRGFSGVAQLSGLGSLSGLLQLCLIEDRLERLPDQLGSLSKLRLLDVSRNGLTSLPQSLFLLPSLQTLIVSSNSLTDESFPLIDTGDVVLTNLHHLDMTGNNLTILPSFLSHTSQLGELRISHNSLSSLDPAIIQSHSQSLRVLEAHNNQLTTLPHQLAACSKLKTLLLTDNPLMDRRLLKLVAQHGTTKPKTVLDYLASHATQSPVKKEGRTKKKGKKKVAVKEEESEEDSDVEFSLQLPKVTILRPDPGTEVVVVATGNARRIRPYIVCSIMRGVVLSEEERMKEFIGLQSRLHDTVCKRRRVATIATHDLARLTPPITFLVAPATDITMRPLGWSQEVKVQEFLCHVESNKPGSGGRKAKGVDTVAASLYKYLQYVEKEEMVYFRDSADTVISLPPLTNSDNSKISENTGDVLVEVTSSDSLQTAKTVMDTLLVGVATILGVESGLRVEQVKVVDEGRQLLVLYPSRTDLTNTNDVIVTRTS